MKLLLSPHNDDECLFCAFTIMRELPLVIVCTDGIKHERRGVATVKGRRQESTDAMKILGAKIEFLGIPDDELDIAKLRNALYKYRKADKVFAPAVYRNGNPDHNTVGAVAEQLFGDKVVYYDTYRLNDLTPQGNVIIFPTEKEVQKKCEALFKYESQLKCNRPHFDAIIGRPEYYVS